MYVLISLPLLICIRPQRAQRGYPPTSRYMTTILLEVKYKPIGAMA